MGDAHEHRGTVCVRAGEIFSRAAAPPPPPHCLDGRGRPPRIDSRSSSPLPRVVLEGVRADESAVESAASRRCVAAAAAAAATLPPRPPPLLI